MTTVLQWEPFGISPKSMCLIQNLDLEHSGAVREDTETLTELCKQYALVLIRGRNEISIDEEFEICKEYYKRECSDAEDCEQSEYAALSKKYEELELENYRLSSELNDAKMTITHLQEDIEMEKQKIASKEEQLAAFAELEEYSSGLREECTQLEETVESMRVRHSDLEQSYASLNRMVNDLRNERAGYVKQLEERDRKIEILEREVWEAGGAKGEVGPSPGVVPSDGSIGVGDRGEGSTPEPGEDARQEVVTESTSQESQNNAPQGTLQNNTLDDTKIVGSVDNSQKDPQSLNSRLSQLEETNRRLLSRLRFLDSRLEAKEESIKRLNSRIEEVVIERDSFKEAMQGLLVGAEEGEERDGPPIPASSSLSDQQQQNWQAVMGSFLMSGTGAGSLVPSPTAGGNGGAAPNVTEAEVSAMRKQTAELKELRKLVPRVEELERSLEVAEGAAQEAEQWADKEFAVLTSRVDSAVKERNEAFEKLEVCRGEVERLQKQISRSAAKYTANEEKLQARQQQLEAVERELRETRARAIDPGEHKMLQDRVQELMGESKHWQQKAQSLSKEMQRTMSIQMELTRVQQELTVAKARIEELEVERAAFREAMQQAISITSDSSPSRTTSQTTASPSTVARQWLRN
eukprot:CAMPEP_0185031236 /NCGR_PEP_ID=MMETSP1103-20130426/18596_1 /TAXON_ID=36769 /ORGANISM="Paraphysomonas bandaiensis, Strain Caron Lab Isolate" /LENGTH=635 /DNA_ID=CAMNT_0027566689 /DNA_START=154 /DNA_END=2058 /DNA_ORIENTATION=-